MRARRRSRDLQDGRELQAHPCLQRGWPASTERRKAEESNELVGACAWERLRARGSPQPGVPQPHQCGCLPATRAFHPLRQTQGPVASGSDRLGRARLGPRAYDPNVANAVAEHETTGALGRSCASRPPNDRRTGQATSAAAARVACDECRGCRTSSAAGNLLLAQPQVNPDCSMIATWKAHRGRFRRRKPPSLTRRLSIFRCSPLLTSRVGSRSR
jgi:hypothetical protein